MNDRFLPGSIAIAVAILALVVMYLSWRRRRARDSGHSAFSEVPAELGPLLATAHGFYVATTVHEHPFERLAVRGLGFRSKAELEVREAGVLLSIPGQEGIFLPARSIQRVAPATWAIDRVVERDGLVMVSWFLPGEDRTTVDSYFRIVDHGDKVRFFEAVHRIAPSAGTPRPAESEV